MSIIQGTAHTSAGGYQISRSLRFNSADSAYLNRTLTTPTNNLKWTWSAWVKRSALGAASNLIGAGDGTSNNSGWLAFNSSNILQFYQLNGGSYNVQMTTSAVFRDVSAWYHIVLVYDSANATSTDRVQIYVNGVRQTVSYAVGPFAQNTASKINSAIAHYIGKLDYTTQYSNEYQTEVNFIDGQALTPSSFGQTNASTGVWEPIKYTGTYGTNGFYLNFSDNSNTTAATLGKDSSGNGNNWTPNNFSVTAGAGNDSLVDTPTSYGSDTGVGGEVRGNYATLNPLAMTGTYSNGNLDFTTAAADSTLISTIAVSSGKWYCEITPTAITANCQIGIVAATARNGFAPTNTNQHPSIVYVSNTGNKFINGTGTTYGATYTTNDVIGIALDLDNLTLQFYKNGTGQGSITGVTSGTYCFAVGDGDSVNTWSGVSNFGQRPFAYTAPSGFKALCTQNLPTPTIGATSTTQANRYFDINTRTGTGSAGSVTGKAFAPDFVWTKSRSAAQDHELYDVLRGATKYLLSDTTTAEGTAAQGLTSFNSDGFSFGTSVGSAINISGQSIVDWFWKANGAGSSNTAGTITSTVSANTTAGFSIVTYTGTGANATVGHGLGVAPSLVIVKRRDGGSGYSWHVQHVSTGNTRALFLDSTSSGGTSSVYWNNTSPTSTVVSVGTDTSINANTGTFVMYAFAPIAGYSAFGSYTGNGSSDGPFVYTGFRPRYVMVKASSTGGAGYDWFIHDTTRDTYNVCTLDLEANLSSSENQYGAEQDILSNGFKLRNTSGGTNGSGVTYIYAAFAESPFKYSLAR